MDSRFVILHGFLCLNNVVFAVLQYAAAAEPWEAENELEAWPFNYPSNASSKQQMLGCGAGSGAAGHLNRSGHN